MVISIIIPAYNAERFIDCCIASIYNTAPSEEMFEVVVINDGSKDNTLSLLNEFCSKHRNLVLIDQPNKGVSAARNTGIEAAHGDYVLFLDADDELIEGALIKLCDYLAEHEQLDMLVTRQSRKRGNNECVVRAPHLLEHKRYDGVEAYKNKFVRTNAGGGICRTDFLRKHNIRFPEGVRNSEDTIFFVYLQLFAKSIVYYDLLLYRINEMEGSAHRSDRTKKGLNLIVTMNAVADIKKNLQVSNEQRGIFDYAVYQLLSNTTSCFAKSKELSYRKLRKEINLKSLLPLKTRYMYLMKRQAMLMNFSYPLFYFFVLAFKNLTKY